MKAGHISRIAVLMLALWPTKARSEWHEASVGLVGGVMLPAFYAPNNMAFALATWTIGIEGLYGLTDDFSLRAAFSTTTFSAKTSAGDTASLRGGDYVFDAAYYHPEAGIRYKLLGGYNVAPYVDADFGYLWATYTRGLHGDGIYALPTQDKSQGNITASVAIAVDYRLFNACFIGGAVRYVHVVGAALTSHFITAPLYAAYYW